MRAGINRIALLSIAVGLPVSSLQACFIRCLNAVIQISHEIFGSIVLTFSIVGEECWVAF